VLDWQPIPARYPGHCRACNTAIHEGQTIIRLADRSGAFQVHDSWRHRSTESGADLGQTFGGSRTNGFGPDPLQYGPIWTNPTLSGHDPHAPDF
jgi:hypothetical protein